MFSRHLTFLSHVLIRAVVVVGTFQHFDITNMSVRTETHPTKKNRSRPKSGNLKVRKSQKMSGVEKVICHWQLPTAWLASTKPEKKVTSHFSFIFITI
jgi:hypothetical protein